MCTGPLTGMSFPMAGGATPPLPPSMIWKPITCSTWNHAPQKMSYWRCGAMNWEMRRMCGTCSTATWLARQTKMALRWAEVLTHLLTCTYTCSHAHAYTHTYTHTHTHTHIFTHVHTYHLHTHLHKHTCTHICMHAHTWHACTLCTARIERGRQWLKIVLEQLSFTRATLKEEAESEWWSDANCS